MSANHPESYAPRQRPPRRRRPPRVLRVFAIPGFARLLASQALFDIGAVARTAAQSWVMYDLTGSNLWVGLVSGVRALPILVFPIFAGAIADRFDKRKLLAFVRIGLAIVSIIQALLIALDILEPWHMLALALAAGTVVAFAMPAFWAYIADLVTPRALPRATALIMMGENAGEMVGPVMVGSVIATAGADWAYGIIASIYLLGAVFILNAPLGRASRVSSARGGGFPPLAGEMSEGQRGIHNRTTPHKKTNPLTTKVSNKASHSPANRPSSRGYSS